MSISKPTPFWLVWNENGRTPCYKHQTSGSASREAERLAAANPGQTFVVLAPTLSIRSNVLEYQHFSSADDMVRF